MAGNGKSSRRQGRPFGSMGQKRKAAEQDREQRISSALEDIRNGSTLKQASENWCIPLQTLGHRKNGRKSRQEAHEFQQALSPAEEDELRDWLKEMDKWSLHLRLELIKSRAQAIRRARGETEPLGCGWIDSFLRRHPEMRSSLSQRQDIQRLRAERDPVRIQKFYDNVSLFAVRF
jgi:hypothetical protein